MDGFRYNPKRTAPYRCPRCRHKYLQFLLTQKQKNKENAKREKAHQKRVEAHEKKPAALQKKGVPRLRLQCEEFKCPCLELKGDSCPLCHGENIDKCEICACKCQVGPIQYKDFEAVARAAQAERRGIQENSGPRTVADQEESFVQLVATAFGCSKRDCEANGIEPTVNNVAGASAGYVVSSQITDDDRNFIGQRVGVPSATLPDGTHISELQRAGTSHRYYSNQLPRSGRRSSASRRGQGVPAREITPRPSASHTHNQRSSAMSSSTLGDASTPPPSRRSSTSSGVEERSYAFERRVFKRIKDSGVELQKDPNTTSTEKKRRRTTAMEMLADPRNNTVKMSVSCEAAVSSPAIGLSQGVAAAILDSEMLDGSHDDSDQKRSKKSKKKKKKKRNRDS